MADEKIEKVDSHGADTKINRRELTHSGFFMIFLALALTFVLVIYQFMSYAWFSSSSTVHAGGLTVSAKDSDVTIMSANVYYVTAISTSTGKYTFVNDEQAIAIPRYDPEKIDFNKYQTAVVVKLTYEISSNETYKLYMRGAEGAIDSVYYADNNFLSNVLSLKTATVSGDFSNEITELEATPGAETYTLTQINPTTEEIELKSASGEIEIMELPSDEGPHTVWFILEYNTDIVRKISDERLKSAMGSSDPAVIDEAMKTINYSSDVVLYIESTEVTE